MAKAGYIVSTNAAVALTAATAQCVLFVVSGAQFACQLTYYDVSFDGVTSTNVPVLVETGSSTAATNSTPGTGNTSQTAAIWQKYGRTLASTGFLAGSACGTNTPTVITYMDQFLLTPNGGTVKWREALGTEMDNPLAGGPVIVCNAPAAVNVRATMEFERI